MPDCEVRAFGSRVAGNAKSYSDLDLALFGETSLDPDRLRLLREAFEESTLAFRVDVVDTRAISEAFRDVIARTSQVLQEAGQPVGPRPD